MKISNQRCINNNHGEPDGLLSKINWKAFGKGHALFKNTRKDVSDQ